MLFLIYFLVNTLYLINNKIKIKLLHSDRPCVWVGVGDNKYPGCMVKCNSCNMTRITDKKHICHVINTEPKQNVIIIGIYQVKEIINYVLGLIISVMLGKE